MSVPPHLLAASLAALGLHHATVAVLHLVGDSLLDEVEPPEGAHRRLVFENADTCVDVVVGAAGGRRQLSVTVAPHDFVDLAVLQPDGRVVVRLRDDHTMVDVPPGLTSLLLRRPAEGGGAVRTAWVVL